MVDEFHVALADSEVGPMQKVWEGSTQTQGALLPMRHSTTLARTGVGFQAAWDQTSQHDQFPTSNYSLLRGICAKIFSLLDYTESLWPNG